MTDFPRPANSRLRAKNSKQHNDENSPPEAFK